MSLGLSGGMLDRTPVLFGERRDFRGVRSKAIEITAVIAVQSFKEIQVSEIMTVKNDMVTTSRLGDAVNGEAYHLVYPEGNVHEEGGDDHRINNGCRKYGEKRGLDDIRKQRA